LLHVHQLTSKLEALRLGGSLDTLAMRLQQAQQGQGGYASVPHPSFADALANNRDRIALMTPKACAALARYIRAVRPLLTTSLTGPPFLGRHGQRLQGEIAREALRRAEQTRRPHPACVATPVAPQHRHPSVLTVAPGSNRCRRPWAMSPSPRRGGTSVSRRGGAQEVRPDHWPAGRTGAVTAARRRPQYLSRAAPADGGHPRRP